MIRWCVPLALGAINVFAFAPHRLWWIPFITLGWLFARVLRAPTVRKAWGEGFAFGLGLFGAGVWWVYIALNTFGQMHGAIAAIATLLFCGYLALFPALAMALARFAAPGVGAYAPFFAAAFFVAAEWLRGHLFTGFAWLTMDHAQAAGSPLLALAPIAGGLGVSFVVCFLAGLIAWAWPSAMLPNVRKSIAATVLFVVALVASQSARNMDWTQPTKNPALAVSLVQGNIAQEVKFRPDALVANAKVFDELAAQAKGALVVLPETTYVSLTPARANEPLVQKWMDFSRSQNKPVIFGAPEIDDKKAYFNAAFAVDASNVQAYRKTHLVPFGEFMPLRSWLGWFYDNVAIPLAGFAPGSAAQPPITLAGEQLGLSICYEDVFARVIRPPALTATMLVNLTNDAWYDQSWAAEQHAQIAQVRAAEFARPMLRATNTGITTHINHLGEEVARLPWFTRAVLETKVQGRTGMTPYAAMGDLPLLLILITMLGIGVARGFQMRSPG